MHVLRNKSTKKIITLVIGLTILLSYFPILPNASYLTYYQSKQPIVLTKANPNTSSPSIESFLLDPWQAAKIGKINVNPGVLDRITKVYLQSNVYFFQFPDNTVVGIGSDRSTTWIFKNTSKGWETKQILDGLDRPSQAFYSHQPSPSYPPLIYSEKLDTLYVILSVGQSHYDSFDLEYDDLRLLVINKKLDYRLLPIVAPSIANENYPFFLLQDYYFNPFQQAIYFLFTVHSPESFFPYKRSRIGELNVTLAITKLSLANPTDSQETIWTYDLQQWPFTMNASEPMTNTEVGNTKFLLTFINETMTIISMEGDPKFDKFIQLPGYGKIEYTNKNNAQQNSQDTTPQILLNQSFEWVITPYSSVFYSNKLPDLLIVRNDIIRQNNSGSSEVFDKWYIDIREYPYNKTSLTINLSNITTNNQLMPDLALRFNYAENNKNRFLILTQSWEYGNYGVEYYLLNISLNEYNLAPITAYPGGFWIGQIPPYFNKNTILLPSGFYKYDKEEFSDEYVLYLISNSQMTNLKRLRIINSPLLTKLTLGFFGGITALSLLVIFVKRKKLPWLDKANHSLTKSSKNDPPVQRGALNEKKSLLDELSKEKQKHD